MDNPIYVGKGISEWVKETHYITGPITKKDVFDCWMQEFKNFYKEYPYAVKWDYEEFIRKILDYYERN